MHTGIFPKEKEYNFVPHITIAQELVEDEFSDVLGTLSMKKIEFEDTVDRFQLCYQLENGSWTVYETFIFGSRSEEHTSELQSRGHLVCRLLLEKKKTIKIPYFKIFDNSNL